jgi:NAD(P)-dependent dehydrogenase (short-subunit alcohol dehydrogenase family)
MKLKGKVALITGAARGIGRSHALRLARLGADIVINDINLEAHKEIGERITANTVEDEVRALGVRCMGIECDVGKKSQAQEMVQKALKEFGKVDILINNAGGAVGKFENSFPSLVSEEDLIITLERNLLNTIYCCQAVAESMKANRWGRIVNTSSQAGLQAQRGGGMYAAYGAAKAGVINYTRYLAQELGPYGITVNCVAPGHVSTPKTEASYSQLGMREEFIKRIPLGRLGVPDDVSKAVEFFVTDLGDYITGQCLSVCGGVIIF